MEKISFKKFAIFFSLASILIYGVVLACADFFMDDKYGSNFAPEIAVTDDSYKPLFLSSEVFYGIRFDQNYVSRFNDNIVKDWSDYLSGKINDTDLSYLLLDTASKEDIKQLHKSILLKQAVPGWTNKIDISDAKVRQFIVFMYYAKEVEKSSTQPIDDWNYEPVKKLFVDQIVIDQVQKLYSESQDPFIKNRFWFQTLKAKFYSSNQQSAIDYFDKTEYQIPKNTLYYRALSYVAGVYYNQKKYDKSNYLYGVVFNNCREMRTVAARNFHPQEQADFNNSLNMAAGIDEKAALWALFGFYADEKQAISEIYQLDPKNINLEFLLTRLINKAELRVNSNELTDVLVYKTKVKTEIDTTIYDLVNNIAKEEKTSKPYLWNIAAGYLNILSGKPLIADQLLEKAQTQTPKTLLIVNQIRLLKLINALYKTTIMTPAVENDLLYELNWLYNECPNLAESEFRYDNAFGWSKLYISLLYKKQNNRLLSEIFNPDLNFYRTKSNLDEMKIFLAKSDKTPWEKLAQGIYDVTLSDINEYQAVLVAYDEKIDQAISFMEQSGHATDTLLANPFNGKIKDCHDCEHALPQKVKYTKISFLRKLKEMKANLENGLDVSNNALLIGNAFYNMTYFGNARVFYYGKIMDQYGNEIDPFYQPLLLDCAKAVSYYKIALNAATNPEQKAKCWYLISKCERNEYYNKKFYRKNNISINDNVDFIAWEGFTKLKLEYSNTQYYKDVIKECGYFKSYASQLP
jgi:hypothetical protein